MDGIKEFWKYINKLREKGKRVKREVYAGCYMIFGVYSLVMSIVCLFTQNKTMVIVNAVIAVWLLISMCFLYATKTMRWATYNTIIFFTGLMTYFMVSGGADGFSIIWMFMVPVAGMYFLGLYYGTIVSFLVGFILSCYMWTPLHQYGYRYTEEYLLRFPMVYWAIAVVCLIIFVRINEFEDEQNKLLQKMDEANKAKSNFLANMSHEIRTPMNAIMGMCELSLQEELSENLRENCENIRSSGENLLGIINDLLDLSKIESGKMELVCEEYSLSALLNDVINMTVARKGGKALEFMVNVDPKVPERLYGDKIRLRQIIINLLTNAVKFTNQGGILLSVSARQESYGINLIISVKDSGIGIEEEAIGKIFTSFSQVDTKRNHAIEGTGLGLPITKLLVQMMNGVILVDSEYGKGTEFKVIIPQKVMQEKPIVSLKEPQKLELLYYINMKKFGSEFVKEGYQQIIETMGTGFGVEVHCCTTKEVTGRWLDTHNCTHLFTGKEEYLEDKAFFAEMAQKLEVIVLQDRIGYEPTEGKVQTLYKPLYCLTMGNVLNKEKISFNTAKKIQPSIQFTAQNAKVLVVDDNQMNLKVAVGLLRPYQMNVTTAMSGEEAIALLNSQSFDLVYMDHMMPEMDGVETVKRIRESEKAELRRIPIVAFTANAVSGMKEMFLSSGFQDFVSKPIEKVELQKTLLKWLPEEYICYEEEGENGK